MSNTNPHELSGIIALSARLYHLTPVDITGPRRDAIACAARADAIYHAKQAGYTMPFLAHFLGRDVSTIWHAYWSHQRKLRRIADKGGK